MADYPILAAPSITLRAFAAVLLRAGSPARGASAAAYAAATSYGVDPAVLLAIFGHESSYGRAGAAVANHSWGNERTAPGYPTIGGFARFPTWETGARDAARLLRVYGKNAIRPGVDTSTVRRLPYVWAPTADGNAPAAYGDALVRSIGAYRTLERQLIAVDVHPTHVATLTDSRIRTAPKLTATILEMVGPGATVHATATVKGAAYRLPDGRTGSAWLRITALNGHPLPSPAYTAALLWRAL